MLDPVLNNPWVRALLGLLLLAGVGLLGYFLSPVLVPLFLAFMVAYALDPVVDAFERRGLRRTVAIMVLAVLGLLLLLAVPVWVLPSLYAQAHDLVAAVASWAQGSVASADGRVVQWLNEALTRLGVANALRELGWAPATGDFNVIGVLGQKAAEYAQENAGHLAQAYASDMATAGAAAGQTLAHVLSVSGRYLVGVIIFLANFALFSFVTGYLLNDYDGIVRALGELVPPRWRETAFRIVERIDDQLRSFLRGQLAVCACLGVMYAIGLLICRVPFALPIALLGAFAGFVPYIGMVLTVAVAVVLTLVRHGVDWHIVGVLVTFTIAQMLEGNVLTPRIVGGKVGLHPVWVILAILVFSQAFGLVGMVIAVPAAAVLKVFAEEAIQRYRESVVFKGDSPGAE